MGVYRKRYDFLNTDKFENDLKNGYTNTGLNNYVSISFEGSGNTTPVTTATTPSWTTPGTITFK